MQVFPAACEMRRLMAHCGSKVNQWGRHRWCRPYKSMHGWPQSSQPAAVWGIVSSAPCTNDLLSLIEYHRGSRRIFTSWDTRVDDGEMFNQSTIMTVHMSVSTEINREREKTERERERMGEISSLPTSSPLSSSSSLKFTHIWFLWNAKLT